MKALLAELIVRGNLPRKSNSRMIVKNPKTDKLMVIKSESAQQYVKDFEKQIPGDLKMGWGSLEQSLALEVVVYYRSRRSDLSIELLKDLLEKCGVIANDRYVTEEHLWGYVDKEDPRIELRLYLLTPESPPFRITQSRQYSIPLYKVVNP